MSHATTPAGDARRRQGTDFKRYLTSPQFFLALIILVLVGLIGAAKPNAFNGAFVVAPLLTSIAIFTIVGLSQMMVLSIGQMNIAVGNMAAFGAMFTGMAFDLWNMPFIVGLIAGLVAGAAIGGLTGWIIAKTGVNSFIVTLAMSFALLGLVPTVYSMLSPGSAFTAKPEGMEFLGRGTFLDVCMVGYCGPAAIPVMVVPVLLVVLLVGGLYARTKLGREILLTGANIKAAELSAIPTNKRVVLVHALSGALASLAGILLATSTGSFTPAIGNEFMLQSFLGPILGGTLLAGGYISVTGTFLGITLTLLIRRGLELFGAGVEMLNIFLGLILLVALSAERIRTVRRRKPTPTPPDGPPPAEPAAAEPAPAESGATA
ncbi:ribose transport system permease protein [Arthrobacter stackebrandtii]|uniref:Ribose transport system permease protein n=1 Tax=Arthrobacter stackebrandtii TaxID=272161 RepID=A0ABS4YST2_9MICC|nr:ABC transporter permease [Arthrobacter stackebrandtii]MBP2411794.1 ribose transport system permease protein [Arthrobacter stackebrandtii]PYG99185.1 ABC transporter permease [Arthrobacter stackebrandtii]